MNKRFISLLLIICCLISCLCFFGCSGWNNDEDDLGYEYSFYLSNNSVVLEKGETFQLLAKYGNEFITYSSSNETVAEITQNGIITAKELGKTQITVKAGGKERICEVEVVTYEYTVSFDKTGPIYAYNDQFTIIELVAFAKKNGQDYTDTYAWTSDSAKCTISQSGNTVLINFNGTGEINVTVTTGKGASKSIKIIVVDSQSDLG